MPTKLFTTGRIKKADYNPNSRQLELHWDNKTVLAYKHVPEEVYRRLCSAPNPTTYWEDRIAVECPKGTSTKSGSTLVGKKDSHRAVAFTGDDTSRMAASRAMPVNPNDSCPSIPQR
jgi:hypothetical protein